jgi:hypothetical protein
MVNASPEQSSALIVIVNRPRHRTRLTRQFCIGESGVKSAELDSARSAVMAAMSLGTIDDELRRRGWACFRSIFGVRRYP